MNPKLPADKIRYRRPLAQILSDLSRPIPEKFLAKRVQGGKTLTYIPWNHVTRLLDYYAPGWTGRIKQVQQIGELVVVTYSLSIHAQEGIFTREATGQESLNNRSFADAVCTAEQQAFKRAAARFGLGLDLYNHDEDGGRNGSSATPPSATPHQNQGRN